MALVKKNISTSPYYSGYGSNNSNNTSSSGSLIANSFPKNQSASDVMSGADPGLGGSGQWQGPLWNPNSAPPNLNQVASDLANSGGGQGTGDSGDGGGGSSWSGSYGGGYTVPSMDFSIFDRMRETAQNGFNSALSSLDSSYQTYLESIGRQRQQGNQQFASGRATIAEDAYDRSRALGDSLASRGLSGSGLQDLGEVQNRMETGDQVSDLANTYYNYSGDLDQTEAEANNQYQTNRGSLEQALNEALNQIDMQKWQAQDTYNQRLAEAARYNAAQSASASSSSMAAGLDSLLQAASLKEQGFSDEVIQQYTGISANMLPQLSGNGDTEQQLLNALAYGDEEVIQGIAPLVPSWYGEEILSGNTPNTTITDYFSLGQDLAKQDPGFFIPNLSNLFSINSDLNNYVTNKNNYNQDVERKNWIYGSSE